MSSFPMPDGSGRSVEGSTVELVDSHGRPIGTERKLLAHEPPGRLHRAISAFLLDDGGRLLIQRRAAGKYHSAGLWSNTCCGHPTPGEAPVSAASRRLSAELGLAIPGGALIPAGIVLYEVADPVSGLVEHEYDHLFVGRVNGPVRPDPAEVSEVDTLSLEDLSRLGGDRDGARGYTAWFSTVLDAAMPALLELRERGTAD